jgi:hypothetical protein
VADLWLPARSGGDPNQRRPGPATGGPATGGPARPHGAFSDGHRARKTLISPPPVMSPKGIASRAGTGRDGPGSGLGSKIR